MPDLPNNGLYITRKRKKWKFAHFDSYLNCFSHGREDEPAKARNALQEYLLPDKPLILELAAGNAQFSLQLANKYPD